MPDSLLDPELDAVRLTPDDEADALLVGGVDLHTHPGPSPFPRRMTILDAARDAADFGFRAIVAKSHHHSMQTDILALGPAGLDEVPVKVFGGVALNRTIGGINPYAVELALRMGGRVVWFPTLSSRAHVAHHHAGGGFPVSGIRLRDHEAISVVGEDGKVTADVREVLAVIAEEGAIMNCGHLPADEIDVLIPAAREAGVERILVSHPGFIIGGSPERTASWAGQGAYIEHCLAFLMGASAPGDLSPFQPFIDAVGVSQSIFSSDLGQAGNPLPLTGYRRLVRLLLEAGYTEEDIRTMTGGNAAGLLLRPEDADVPPATGDAAREVSVAR